VDTVTIIREMEARLDKKKGFKLKIEMLSKSAQFRTGFDRSGIAYHGEKFESPSAHLLIAGGLMERTEELLKMVNEEIAESKKILQKLSNEVRVAFEAVHPTLIDQIKELRETRMTMVREIQAMLDPLRDIRKFFFSESHEQEMKELQKFITLCQELSALKQSGVLDAILDSVIRLSIKEVSR